MESHLSCMYTQRVHIYPRNMYTFALHFFISKTNNSLASQSNILSKTKHNNCLIHPTSDVVFAFNLLPSHIVSASIVIKNLYSGA